MKLGIYFRLFLFQHTDTLFVDKSSWTKCTIYSWVKIVSEQNLYESFTFVAETSQACTMVELVVDEFPSGRFNQLLFEHRNL